MALMTDGGDVYARSCASCHGAQGEGGFGPQLAGNPFVGEMGGLVNQILGGSPERGMPPFAPTLNDQQIAAVATFVRNSWGNSYGAVAPAFVAQARGAGVPG
jgi:mono/diheme cytochrome c family protein